MGATQSRGVIKPDDLDHALVLEIAEPYLGEMVGVNPSEEMDSDDPWQFRNMRVT
jgi:homospermidine synthase